jgi:hypothetical protein
MERPARHGSPERFPRPRADSLLSDTPPPSPRRRGSLDLSDRDEAIKCSGVLAAELKRDILNIEDPVVATAWVVLLLCGVEACSVVLTSRVIHAWPFGLMVAAAELILGPLTVLPFWLCNARPGPGPHDVPRFWFPACVALAAAAVSACLACDPRGAPIVRELDVNSAWRALGATRRDLSSAYAALLGGGTTPGAAQGNANLATWGRLGPRAALAPARVLLEALGAYAGASPRPLTTAGSLAALGAAGLAAHVASRVHTSFGGGAVISDPATLGVLACAAFGTGLLTATWHAAATRTAALGVDERPPANVAAGLGFLAGLLLLPYAVLVQGPEAWGYAADWQRVAYLVTTAAFAGQLKRELQVHALRSLPPGAACVLGAARRLAVALAAVAGAG